MFSNKKYVTILSHDFDCIGQEINVRNIIYRLPTAFSPFPWLLCGHFFIRSRGGGVGFGGGGVYPFAVVSMVTKTPLNNLMLH